MKNKQKRREPSREKNDDFDEMARSWKDRVKKPLDEKYPATKDAMLFPSDIYEELKRFVGM